MPGASASCDGTIEFLRICVRLCQGPIGARLLTDDGSTARRPRYSRALYAGWAGESSQNSASPSNAISPRANHPRVPGVSELSMGRGGADVSPFAYAGRKATMAAKEPDTRVYNPVMEVRAKPPSLENAAVY